VAHKSYAAIIVRSPEQMVMGELAREPLAAGQVRVCVEATGVNPVDAGNRLEPSWAGLSYPFVVGYEFAGEVMEVEAPTSDYREGDRVWGLLPVRGTPFGAYAEEVVASVDHVGLRPQGLDPLEAAVLPLAGGTAVQLFNRLDPQRGELMLVHGAAGGVGHLLVQLARARGVKIAAPASTGRHAFLARLGVEVIVDRHHPDALRMAREQAGGDFHVVADLVGGQIAGSLPLMAEGGRAGAVASLDGDLSEALDRNITLHGVLVRPGQDVLAQLNELVNKGRVRPHVREALPLAAAEQAHDHLSRGGAEGKIVLTMKRH
jgi:NADPH:quinone reductase